MCHDFIAKNQTQTKIFCRRIKAKNILPKDGGQQEKGATEDEMVGWHHQLNGHESEQALGDSEGQGSLVCCSPWGRKESDTTK